MELVERQTQLTELEEAVRDAAAGRGNVVLITGGAGAGKTALARRFAAEVNPKGRVLWGMCDELATPRPLGPFRDILGQLGSGVASDSMPAMLDVLVRELDRAQHPPVVLVEDVQWADEATLDAVRFLGRRVGRKPASLVMTYRDDEVPADHPLRIAISAVPPDDIRRITLPPLSRHGVAQLAGRDDVDELHRITGGNPFYVTEVLAAPAGAVPKTVQDAVMARIGRLSHRGRACAKTAAVVPGRAERWLLDACGVTDGIDDAADLGVLHIEGDVVWFSHELARRAVEQSLTMPQREKINNQVLEVLVAHDADPSRLAHHAVRANDADAVARFAPVAARRAASLDAHREAVAHFRQALDRPEPYSRETLAGLWYEYAVECSRIERHDSADRALHEAVAIHTEIGDQTGLGADLTLRSEVQWLLGRGKEAEQAVAGAVAVLGPLPASAARAWAYAQYAKLAMVDWRAAEAVAWGEKAIALADSSGDAEVMVNALTTVGSAKWMIPPFVHSGLLEGLELARKTGLNSEAARAYDILVEGYRLTMDYAQAGRYIEEGLAFCEAHDLLTAFNWLQAHRAAWHLEQGRWTEAEDDARRAQTGGEQTRALALTVLGCLQARRGDYAAEATMDEAQRLADHAGDARTIVPVGLARAELAWLQGRGADVAPLAAAMLDVARRTGSGRWIGEAAMWLHRSGSHEEPPSGAGRPYALKISGHWKDAAATWAKVGRLYEQADALAEASEPEPLLEGLAILDGLGAAPRAAMVRRRLAEQGVRSVPRGPQRNTRASPAGLTARQTEVLRLLAKDLTYREIAQRMHLSVKTVDHHAAAVRAKLDATTSREAVAAARRLGILDTGETRN
jgi:DNA-binding CsgD family transcriptional regulator